MKFSKLLIILTVAFNIIILGSVSVNAAPKMTDKIAAIVDNNIILESEVLNMINNIKATTDPNNLPDDTALRNQVIDRLIVESLILQQADKNKILVTNDEVTAAVTKIATENGMDIAELREKLTSMGINYARYFERIKKEILIEQVRINAIRQRTNISEKDIESIASTLAKQRANNTEVDISHILIAIPEKASQIQIDRANNQANDILERLNKGESFAKLATTYSNDDYALKGGAMGWHHLEELPSIFESALTQAKKGALIGPIRSGVGFHIIKVNNTRSLKDKPITAEEVNVNHILIKTNVLMTDDKAKQKLVEIRQAILAGKTSFGAEAKKYSEDIASAGKEGNLGWNSPDIYDENFKNALLKLKKGEISQPVKSNFGWHLIELVDRRNVDKTALALKDQAYRLIFNKRLAEESPIWIQELKSNAYIKIIDAKTNNITSHNE